LATLPIRRHYVAGDVGVRDELISVAFIFVSHFLHVFSAIRVGRAQSEQRLSNKLDDMGFEPRQTKRPFSSPNRQERSQGPARLLFNEY
jgi:hypothetical protein